MAGEKLHPDTITVSGPHLFEKVGDYIVGSDGKRRAIIRILDSNNVEACSSIASDFCPDCEANTKGKVVCKLKEAGLV